MANLRLALKRPDPNESGGARGPAIRQERRRRAAFRPFRRRCRDVMERVVYIDRGATQAKGVQAMPEVIRKLLMRFQKGNPR